MTLTRPFPCCDFYDMQTETRDTVNESSYGCVSAQTPPFQSALKRTAGCLQVCSFYIEGLAQASSAVGGQAHTFSHQRIAQTQVIN